MKTFRYAAALGALMLASPMYFLAQNVPYERILHSANEPQSWLTYSGSYNSQQYSPLKQINRENISKLKVAWIYQPSKAVSNLEASPIVADGVMYITEPPSSVTALDVRTGLRLWTWSPTLPEHVVSIGLYATSRGVAILGDSVFIGTADSHLVALDAKNGAVRWDVHVADNAMGYAMTGPPLALKRSRRSRIPRRVRSENRKAAVAILDHAAGGRTGSGNLGRRCVRKRGRDDLEQWILRS
jgi:glucose dehydrogenase